MNCSLYWKRGKWNEQNVVIGKSTLWSEDTFDSLTINRLCWIWLRNLKCFSILSKQDWNEKYLRLWLVTTRAANSLLFSSESESSFFSWASPSPAGFIFYQSSSRVLFTKISRAVSYVIRSKKQSSFIELRFEIRVRVTTSESGCVRSSGDNYCKVEAKRKKNSEVLLTRKEENYNHKISVFASFD